MSEFSNFSSPQAGDQRQQQASAEFRRARKQAAMERLTGWFTGKSLALLSYEDVSQKLMVTHKQTCGLQEVPIKAIVGSVGRYEDFTRSFLPRRDSDEERWTGVRTAALNPMDLPPIEVYQIGEVYFVLDGNHRVSVARQLGLETLRAHVTEVITKVPLPAGMQPDELIISSEYAAFLDSTHLDELRPEQDLRVSVPGQYWRLENHIEVHRFFVEMAEERDLSDAEAVAHWYDHMYWPLVTTIRQQDLLKDFPGRTETDLYIWTAEHQAGLRNAMGWQVREDVAVREAAVYFKPETPKTVTNTVRKAIQAIVPKSWQRESAPPRWSQQKALDRYSQALFADILVLLQGSQAWQQAIIIGKREASRLVGLQLDEDDKDNQLEFVFECQDAGLAHVQATIPGNLVDTICQNAAMTDLVVLSPSAYSPELAACCTHPILLVPSEPSPLTRMLLAYDPQQEDTLFVAAYLAEEWGVSLTIALPTKDVPDYVQKYVEMHELEANFVTGISMTGEVLKQVAEAHQADLFIGRTAVLAQLNPSSWHIPILICH